MILLFIIMSNLIIVSTLFLLCQIVLLTRYVTIDTKLINATLPRRFGYFETYNPIHYYDLKYIKIE
jgi:hypothetical protein